MALSVPPNSLHDDFEPDYEWADVYSRLTVCMRQEAALIVKFTWDQLVIGHREAYACSNVCILSYDYKMGNRKRSAQYVSFYVI